MLGSKLLGAVAIVFAGYGLYLLTKRARSTTGRRASGANTTCGTCSVWGSGVATVVALLEVATDQWVGVLFSLGVVGFAVTFALQQPLFSLIGWLYIMVKRPYQVGDRVAIEGSKGDVVEVDFLVTTLWEINGDLVSSNQPSGRIITLPNSVVLSSHVKNYTREDFPFVWNEAFHPGGLRDRPGVRAGPDAGGGGRLPRRRDGGPHRPVPERLSGDAGRIEVQDRPSVNVVQEGVVGGVPSPVSRPPTARPARAERTVPAHPGRVQRGARPGQVPVSRNR